MVIFEFGDYLFNYYFTKESALGVDLEFGAICAYCRHFAIIEI